MGRGRNSPEGGTALMQFREWQMKKRLTGILPAGVLKYPERSITAVMVKPGSIGTKKDESSKELY